MKIGIGSKNKVKISACKNALEALKTVSLIDSELEITFYPVETETSVPDMPLSREILMKGALQRALFVYKNLEEQDTIVDYALGMEGGVYTINFNHRVKQHAFLQNWVYAFNGNIGFFGSSASLPLPENISHALFKEKRELSEVMDSLSGRQDVRSKEGAFGILTNNLITRSDSFETALMNALTPFFNKRYYQI
jgi:inosine/xanthosine triphosphatase